MRAIRKDGGLIVEDDTGVKKTLSPSQCVLTCGYAVTSYGSQGKTVDTVLFSDAANRAATNAQQWYVTISRGRKRVIIFTADREELSANVERAGGRELALDLKPEMSTAAAQDPRLAEGTRRLLETIERTRLHNIHMALVQQGQRQTAGQRIAV